MRITSSEVVEKIHEMKNERKSKLFVSKQLNLSYNTVRVWWNKDARVAQLAEAKDLKSLQCGFESHLGYQYSYLLGLYLGDGYITLHQPKNEVYKIQITQDSKYEFLILQHKQAVNKML